MTTGRINQVAFLPDAGARMSVPLGAPFGASVGRPRRVRRSFASRDDACSLDDRGRDLTSMRSIPHPRERAETSWAEAAKHLSARHAGNTELASRPPRTRKGKADGENRNQKFRFVGKQHRIPNEPSRQQLRLGKD